MRPSRRWVAALGMMALLAGADMHAAGLTERARQKRAAENQHAELRQKLNALKRDISSTEAAKSHAADALAHSEKAISDANRALRDLMEEQKQTEARLAELTGRQDALARTIASQRQRLGKLLREQYMAGNEDRTKLLLSGDNPNRINRELQYMGYVSRAQAELIGSLDTNLRAIESNKASAQNARDELEEIAGDQREQKALLEQEQARRASLLAQLSGRLAAQRKEAGNLERDQQRLASLVDNLSRLIEEQRKAEAAAREKAARDKAEREKAEREKRRQERQEQLARAATRSSANNAAADAVSKGKSKNQSPNPDAIDDDEPPPKNAARTELASVADIQRGGPMHGFNFLRGRLQLPVKGELIAKYGGRQGDGPSLKGLFIRARQGAEVRAVAGGQVVFAEWLRGFGNIVIIDHGDQYMTIYGNNQAVLKQAGDIVKTGEIIASAGNSGGNEESGLYFEMRHQGRAFDPLQWVSIR